MAKHTISRMDASGDTLLAEWDTDVAEQVEAACEQFYKLMADPKVAVFKHGGTDEKGLTVLGSKAQAPFNPADTALLVTPLIVGG